MATQTLHFPKTIKSDNQNSNFQSMSSIDAFLRFTGLSPNTNAKGNKGKGAANRRGKFLGCVLVAFVVLLSLVHVLLPDSRLDTKVMHHAKQLRQKGADVGAIASAAAAAARKHGSTLGQKHGNNNNQRQRSTFNKHEVAELIMQGKLNLVDIRPKHGELADAPEDTYDGIYGTFCRLNFAVHKEDPSSGTLFILISVFVICWFVAVYIIVFVVFHKDRSSSFLPLKTRNILGNSINVFIYFFFLFLSLFSDIHCSPKRPTEQPTQHPLINVINQTNLLSCQTKQ